MPSLHIHPVSKAGPLLCALKPWFLSPFAPAASPTLLCGICFFCYSQILFSVTFFESHIFQYQDPDFLSLILFLDVPGGSDGKASVYNAGDLDSSPGLGRSPGEGNGSPLQCCCLEDPMDRGGWYATVCGVAKSRTRLSNFTSLHFNPLPGDWSPVPEFQAEIRSSDPLTGHLWFWLSVLPVFTAR